MPWSSNRNLSGMISGARRGVCCTGMRKRENMKLRDFFATHPVFTYEELGLLQSICSHLFLKNRLSLKGGTALNLFIFDLPHLFSVDRDLNYAGAPFWIMEKLRYD